VSALDITEKEWDAQLFSKQKGLATMLGWELCYHTLRSKGSAPGFPDRVLVRDRVVFVELKREGQKVRYTQRQWMNGLAAAGAEVYLWFPSDLDEVANVLGKRWTFVTDGPYDGPRLVHGFDAIRPVSLWPREPG
jgi:hypothetical protein